jgi:hypothetical protein
LGGIVKRSISIRNRRSNSKKGTNRFSIAIGLTWANIEFDIIGAASFKRRKQGCHNIFTIVVSPGKNANIPISGMSILDSKIIIWNIYGTCIAT